MLFDAFVTKGKITRQIITQMVINTSVTGLVWTFSDDEKFDPKQIVDIALEKYQVGKIKILIKAIVPSLFDITYKDGVQIVVISKGADKVVKDIVGNVITEGVDIKVSKIIDRW